MKFIYTLLLAVFSFTAIFAQTKKPLITKRTATWCPNCGSWGWDAMEEMIDEADDKVLVLGTHYSGGLFTPLNGDLAGNFPFLGQPAFFLNGVEQGVLSSNWEDKVDAMMAEVEGINAEAADFDINLIASHEKISNTNYKLRAKINVTSNIQDNGENYHLAIYVVRDDMTAGQAGQSGNPAHPNVPVAVFGGNSFGDPISTTEGTAGEQQLFYDFESSLNVNRAFLAAIVWKEIDVDGEQFWEVVNTDFSENLAALTTSNEDLNQDISLKIYQRLDLNLQIESSIEVQQFQLLDMSGRVITSKLVNERSSTIDIPQSLPAGIYTAQLKTELGISTSKVFLK